MSQDGYLPPGVTDDMIPGNSRYDGWYESNYEDNLDAFIERDLDFAERLIITAHQLEPELKDDTVWDYVNSHVEKVCDHHFKNHSNDLEQFNNFCEGRYENSFEPDPDAAHDSRGEQ